MHFDSKKNEKIILFTEKFLKNQKQNLNGLFWVEKNLITKKWF